MRRPQPFTTFTEHFSGSAVEREAERILAFCQQRLGLTALPLPVPVEEWIEGPLGIRFSIEDLSGFGNGILGAASIKEREIRISETLLSNEARMRFTCAHELGHLVLHGRLQLAFRDAETEPGRRDPHEREADRFAAAFMMPAEAVVSVLLDLCAEKGFVAQTLREILCESSDDTAELSQWLAVQLSNVFGVSRLAALFRLKETVLPAKGPYVLALSSSYS